MKDKNILTEIKKRLAEGLKSKCYLG